MTLASWVLVGVAAVLVGVMFRPRLVRSELWQATVTPLASIIGSGFLVAGPILASTAGRLAWLAMLALCAVAWLFGSAIRHNIRFIEPQLHDDPPVVIRIIERLSELTLAFAYFVSVAYYLNLFAAFGLRVVDVVDPFWIKVVATVVIACVGTVGTLWGLDGLERVAVSAVGLKLGLIGGLLVALVVATIVLLTRGQFTWVAPDHPHGWHELSILLGLVILVQGFETSRYLGDAYNADTRIKTMRWAQLLATGIYLSFILLITSFFTHTLPDAGGETAIIDMLRPVGLAVSPVIIITALASQLSAAVADTNGAGGLLAEALGGRIKVRIGNLITAMAAIAIIWLVDIYQLITWASKMFVAYYGLQSAQAAMSAWKRGQRGLAAVYALGVVIALAVIVFAVPAKA